MGLLEVDCCSSECSTMTMPVIRDEKANMIELAVRTPLRAEETPVRRETTTKMLRGTRKRDESYITKLGFNNNQISCEAYCRSMFIGNESTTKCALNRIIHPNTSFEKTKSIKSRSFIFRSDSYCQRRSAYGTDHATEFRM